MGQVAAGLLDVDFREKTLYFNHGFNDRGFSIGNSTFGSESSVSNGESAVITVSEWCEWAKWPLVSLLWIFAKNHLF